MPITDILPWKREERQLPIRHDGESFPLLSLQNEMNRLFEDFWRNPFSMRPFERMWPPGMSGFDPQVDISETDKEIKIEAELPGLDENDIDISISNNVLTIKGEKRGESEKKERNYYFAERSYGSFSRQFSLPSAVDEDKIEATFKKGVLNLTLPKRGDAVEQRKRIAIKKP
jgi:HSP20 family protein